MALIPRAYAPPVKPITLTREQFRATPEAAKGGTYEQYKAYIAKRRKPAVKPAAGGARAPIDPNWDYAMRVVGLLGPDDDTDPWEKAGSLVDSRITPILDRLTAKAREGGRIITESGTQFADKIASYAPMFAGASRAATGAYAGLGDALANFLNSSGQEVSANLAGSLGSFNAPSAPADAATAAALGKNIAATSLANTSAGAERMVTEGDAQTKHALTLPGVSLLGSQQNLADFLGKIEGERADLQAEIPGMVSELGMALMNARDNRRGDRASLVAQLLEGRENRALQRALTMAGYNIDLKKLAAAERESLASASTAAGKLGLPNAALSAKYGYIVDSYGQPILRNGQRQPVAKNTSGGGGGLTESQRATAVRSVIDDFTRRAQGQPGNPMLGVPAVPGLPRSQAANMIRETLRAQMPGIDPTTLEQLTDQVLAAVYPGAPGGTIPSGK